MSVPHFPPLISVDILVVAVRVSGPLCLLLQEAWKHRSFLEILVSGPLDRYPAVRLLDRTVALVSVFEGPPHCFPQRLRLFAFPPVAQGVPFALIPAGRGCFPFSCDRPVSAVRWCLLMGFPFLPMICDVEGLFMSLLAIRVWCLEKFFFFLRNLYSSPSPVCLRIRLLLLFNREWKLQAEQPGKKKERKVIQIREEEVKGSIC